MIVTKNCDIRPRPVQFPRAAEEAENDTGHNIVEAELALDVAEQALGGAEQALDGAEQANENLDENLAQDEQVQVQQENGDPAQEEEKAAIAVEDEALDGDAAIDELFEQSHDSEDSMETRERSRYA